MDRRNDVKEKHAAASASSPDSTHTSPSDSDCYKSDFKVKTRPLPTFNGSYAEWRSFQQHFEGYMGKMRKLSDSGKLNYLQDAIKTLSPARW